jgi:hypothetical protein
VLPRDRRARRLLSGLGVSSLGDGMSNVTIAWLAVRTAPAGQVGLFVGLAAMGALAPVAYVAVLAGSSLLAAWGSAGQYTMLAELGGAEGRLAANSLASAQVWLATILGPASAGLLLARVAPGWLLAFDAASFSSSMGLSRTPSRSMSHTIRMHMPDGLALTGRASASVPSPRPSSRGCSAVEPPVVSRS